MRHLRNLGLVMVAIVTMFSNGLSPSTAHAADLVTKGIVDVNSSLNLREEATIESESLLKLRKGEILTILEEEDSNGWYKVEYEEYTGYVKGDYIVRYTRPKEATKETDGFVDMANTLNLREKPTTNSKSLAYLKLGEIVKIVSETDNGWYEVYWHELHGYVSKTYIVKSNYSDFELISTFKTTSNSSANRDFNMARACQSVTGTVLRPGEAFNWFKVVGNCNKANGYKESIVIKNGKYTPGYGGGVCQVSTTIYNLIYKLGIKSDVLHHHSLKSSYVDEGMDATVSYPSANFVFTNRTDYTMLIEMYTRGGTVYGCIYKIEN